MFNTLKGLGDGVLHIRKPNTNLAYSLCRVSATMKYFDYFFNLALVKERTHVLTIDHTQASVFGILFQVLSCHVG